MKQLNYIFIFILFISGCSSKQYFEPSHTENSYLTNSQNLDSYILDYNADGATLHNYKYISKDGVSSNIVKKGFKFISKIDDTNIATDNNGTLLIQNETNDTEYKFDKKIVSAALKNDLVALGFIDNSISLYNIKTKQIIFKEYFKASAINNIKIANPIFLKTVVLYPTLDGKVVIVDINKKQILKTINIDPKNKINNIILLSTINDNLIAATSKKLFTFIDGSINIKDFEIKQIFLKNEDIYIATLDGQIIHLDKKLNILNSKKFKFANFHALGGDKHIFGLECQGFLIKLDLDLNNTKIYDFNFNENEKAIIIGDTLYFNNKSIILK